MSDDFQESTELALYPNLTPVQRTILENLNVGNTRSASAEAAGISRMTFYRWMDENVTFCDAVKKAEATAEVGHVKAVAYAAQKGTWQASAWWLERRRPRNWREIKTLDVSQIPTETLIALLEREDREGVDEEGSITEAAADSGSS